jgi:hypothetical protein
MATRGIGDVAAGTPALRGRPGAHLLVAGALCSFGASGLHVACIVGGPAWYRSVGAGERIATMAARGHWYPTSIALAIAAVLAAAGAYALSGAGMLPRLPLLRTGLCVIATVYLGRALAFPLLMPSFPGNSTVFWIMSSAICLAMGLLHAVGAWRAWPALRA